MEEILRFEHVSYAYEEEREALLDVCVKVCASSPPYTRPVVRRLRTGPA